MRVASRYVAIALLPAFAPFMQAAQPSAGAAQSCRTGGFLPAR